MAVNFGLLQPAQPVSAFFQGQQDVQREAEQNMLRQQQAEQMQFQRENMAAQRAERLAMAADRQAMTQERAAKAAQAAKRQEFLINLGTKMAEGGYKLDRPTLGQVLQFGMQTGEDSLIKLATEGMRALDEEEVYAREATRFGLPGAAAPAAGEPANALAAPAAAGITRETVQNMMISPSARIREQGKALAQTLPKEEATPSDVAAMKALGFPLTAAGYAQFRDAQRQERLLSPEEEAQRVRIARESRPLPQPREPKEPPAPIPVVDPATGQVKYVPRDQAVGMTPPQFMESLTPKERQSREAKFPQATSAVKTFETTSNTLIKDLETLAKHPGLSSITGIAAGRLPGITSAGREAEALFDKISARGGFQELQNMRQASPTGGALGNVSNQEGAQLRQAFAALDRRQDAASVRKAIADAINQIRASQQTIKDAYDMTYEYKQGGGGAAPTPASPNIDALLNKYK
jgi:hypothetical protein